MVGKVYPSPRTRKVVRPAKWSLCNWSDAGSKGRLCRVSGLKAAPKKSVYQRLLKFSGLNFPGGRIMSKTRRTEPRPYAAVFRNALDAIAGTVKVGIAFLAVVTLFASSAMAQLAGTGAISGIITDPTGAVIPDATVTATNVGTNVKTIRTSTGAGDYNITPLQPGVYTVSVVAKGFQQHIQENVTVDALVTVNLPIQLTVGRTDETVTVSTAPPILATQDASLGGVMDNEMYSSLPLMMGAGGNADQRRATDFAYLMPGVQSNNINTTSQSGIVNGSGPGGNVSEIYIEGVNLPEADGVGDPRFTWTAIGVDAVDQFQVQTAGIGAQYGGQGMQNYSVKSGSNSYHGSLYEYIRNTMFDSWSFASKVPVVTGPVPAGQTCAYNSTASSFCAPGGVKPREIMNEFGIVLSGPIWKNRLFLFGNYGQYRYQAGARPTTMFVPNLAMMGYADTSGNALGYADFRGYTAANGASIYDPATQVPNCSSCSRSIFQGVVNGVPTNNVIPASRLSAASQYYNKYLLPYQTLVNQSLYTNNLVYGTPIGLANWYATGRIDYTVSQRNQIGLVIAFGRQSSTGQNSGSGLNPPFNTSQSYHPVTTIDIIKDTFTITPHLINQFAFGYGRYQSDSVTPNRQDKYSATGAGILNMPSGQASDGFPGISWSGSFSNPGSWGGYSWNNKINNTYTITDTVQWVKGKHNLTLGGQFVDTQFNYLKNVTFSAPMGIQFSSAQTSNFSSGSSTNSSNGYSFASYMIGAANTGTTSVGVPGLGTRWEDPSFWGQDDYKVNSKLTLNLGLRWDIYPSIKEAKNYFTFLNPNGTNAVTGNKGTLWFAGNGDSAQYCNCTRPSPIYWKNIAPRIGLAYSVDSKTVIRASYNVNFARGNWTSGSQSGSPSTLGVTPSAAAPSGASAAPAYYWDSTACTIGKNNSTACGWTGSVVAPAPPTGGKSLAEYATTNTTALGNSGGATITGWDPYRGSRTPEFINWTFGVQRQLIHDITINVSYVGSQGHFISASGLNLKLNNKVNSSYLPLAGYNFNSSTGAVTPCSGSACGNGTNLTDLLGGTKGTAAALAATAGLGFAPQNPYTTNVGYNSANNNVIGYYLPFPQYTGVSDTTSFAGNTNYNALQLTFSQRTSHGLSFTVNYTYSKTIDDVGTFRLAEKPRLDRGISTIDTPQNLVAYSTYALPFGHGKIGGDNFWVNALAGGWRLSGIYTYHSGVPLVATGSGCGSASILGTCMPNIVPSVAGRNGNKYGDQVTAAPGSPNYYATKTYLNFGAFSVNNAGTLAQYNQACSANSQNITLASQQLCYVGNGPDLYVPGNAPRVGALNVWSQGVYNLDMSVKRDFSIYKEWKLAFEASAFNVTNHVYFGAVNGGVGGSSYGQVGAPPGVNLPRYFQFSGRFSF
jgi:hypothetical protein